MYIQLKPKLYTYPKHAFSLSQGPNELCAAFQSLPTWARTSLITRFLRSSWWNGHRERLAGIAHPALPETARSEEVRESETGWAIYKSWDMCSQFLLKYQQQWTSAESPVPVGAETQVPSVADPITCRGTERSKPKVDENFNSSESDSGPGVPPQTPTILWPLPHHTFMPRYQGKGRETGTHGDKHSLYPNVCFQSKTFNGYIKIEKL